MALIKKTLDTLNTAPAVHTDWADWQNLLQRGCPAQRREAVQALESHPHASRLLVEQLQREMDLSVRERIFASLLKVADDEAISGLVTCLRSEDAALRNQSIETLKEMPERIGPILESLLEDTDPDVRIFTVNILESLQYPLVEELLIKVITHDNHVNVCATAVDLLGEVGDEKAQLALQTLKQRFPGEPYIQFAADLALKRINEA